MRVVCTTITEWRLPCRFHIFRNVLYLILLAGCVLQLSAQEAPPDTAPSENDQKQTERIVDGRPPLYFLGRAIHPVTWVEAGIRPIVRSAEGGRLLKLAARPQ